jgi:hypothetical protein
VTDTARDRSLEAEKAVLGAIVVENAHLPYPLNIIGTGAKAVGGGDDFYQLYKEDHYDLPFRVQGYFNLRGCELVDEPGETFRHYVHIVSTDEAGRVQIQKETQLEARAREDMPTPEQLESWFRPDRT